MYSKVPQLADGIVHFSDTTSCLNRGNASCQLDFTEVQWPTHFRTQSDLAYGLLPKIKPRKTIYSVNTQPNSAQGAEAGDPIEPVFLTGSGAQVGAAQRAARQAIKPAPQPTRVLSSPSPSANLVGRLRRVFSTTI